MNSKTFTLTAFSILALVLVLGFASAAMNFNPSSLSLSATQGATDTESFTINNTATGNMTNISYDLTNLISGSNTLLSSALALTNVPNYLEGLANDSVTLTLTVPSSQATGTYTGNITFTGNYTLFSNYTLPVSVVVTAAPLTYTFCSTSSAEDNDLTLNVDISNLGTGKDEEWNVLDTIEVEVELENDKDLDGEGDLNDVIFEIGLFEEGSDRNIIDDMVWMSEDNEEFQFGDIDESDDGKHVFKFKIDPAEVNSGNYILMVKAYPNGDESDTCIDHSEDLSDSTFGDNSAYYATIDISKESDRDKMVVVDDDSESMFFDATCGSQVALNADVWNIGNRDFEDQIMVNLYNNELGIDIDVVVLGDLDEGDNTEVSFLFNVPLTAQEKQYTLNMRTYYEYDEDSGKYATHYDRESDDTFRAYLRVEGNCASSGHSTSPVISAILESEAKAGQDLVVRTLVTNPSDSIITYIINAAGYAEWASTAELSQNSFTLGPGETEEVLITLAVKEDATEGTKTFNIELVSEGLYVDTQAVEVYIEGKSGFNFTGPAAYAYALGLLSIILIIIIVIVAVRLARK